MSAARIHAAWPTPALGLGLVLVFVGERVLDGMNPESGVVAALGGGALLAALAARLGALGSAPEGQGAVRRWLLLSTLGVVLSMAVYGAVAHLVPSGDGAQRLRGVLHALWPILLVVSAAPLAAIEIAVLPAARVPRYELRRVRAALERGLAFGLLLSVGFLANWLASRHEWKVDLSSGKKAEATAPTRGLVRDLTQPVKVTLFYARADEVGDELERYFDSLRSEGSSLEVSRIDHALAGTRASDAGVSENGYVAVSHDKTHEKIRVGTDPRSARSALRNFDANFAKALVKVSRSTAVAYFTVGHDERRTDPSSEDPRPSLRLLGQQLKANQYEVKTLGVADGLASEIPKDAAIVFVMGPEKPFLPEETATLVRALKRGVRMLIALEGEREAETLEPLLSALGLRFDPTLLANERAFVRVSNTEADRRMVYSNRYSSHASVTTMTRHSTKLATLFAGTGSLERLEPPPPGMRADLVLTALDATFRDTNGNLTRDEGERQESFGLAAAVVRTSTAGAEDETRVFVLSDVDVLTDKYVKFQGNPYLVGDIVYWLRDVKEPVLPTVSESDVRIVHKRDEDALWFYSTTLGVPALVLLAGLVISGRRRRR